MIQSLCSCPIKDRSLGSIFLARNETMYPDIEFQIQTPAASCPHTSAAAPFYFLLMNTKKRISTLAFGTLGLVLALTFHSAASAEVVFSESFESPVVSGFQTNTVPDNGNWVGSRGPFNASVRGPYNDNVNWPAVPVFTTPYGDQAYYLNYSTTMLTTAQGATGQTITADVTYTLTFNAAHLEGTTANYRAELVAFGPDDDNSVREDSNNPAGTIVASAGGEITSSDMSNSFSIVFTPDSSHPNLGEELAIRFDDAD